MEEAMPVSRIPRTIAVLFLSLCTGGAYAQATPPDWKLYGFSTTNTDVALFYLADVK
jgi:hypothetical protein